METRINRTQRDYTLAFKLPVVDQVEKGDLTYKLAQELTGSRQVDGADLVAQAWVPRLGDGGII